MALIVTFLLGMGNFACHRAVIHSGNRMITDMPTRTLQAARISSLLFEFGLLCGAFYAARAGELHWIWLYAAYFAINAAAAWAVVTRRI
ncbi:hypothetical protein [Aurantiacibacter hainanensis]|uniref:hypothetical protein n=1 Tax=Aurantiacibacter hainanensis TaxID=3076114 RepID=UPI0030C6C0FA